MRFNSLNDWLQWLENLHPTAIDLGLSRVSSVASVMGLTKPAKRVVTVAGTNGKGSCAAALESMLIGAGLRVGIYTSPHLIHYCERVRLLGVPVTEDLMCEALAAVDRVRGSTSLTYFEFGTLAALHIFAAANLDVVVLEVGLGGRLDAVNIVDPDIAVITSIALDHQEWLGNDRESIAYEKAGIIRQASPVVCSDYSPPVSVRDRCQEYKAKWYGIGEQFGITEQGNQFVWYGLDSDAKSITLELHSRPQLPEPSVAAALQVVQLLGLGSAPHQDVLAQGVANAVLAGRYQQFCKSGIDIVLDVAHNPAAAQMFAQRLSQESCKGKTVAVFSMLIDKDIAAVIAALDAEICISRWYIAEIRDPSGSVSLARSASLADLERLIESRSSRAVDGYGGAVSCQSLSEAFIKAKNDCQIRDRILVFGSFYTVAEILSSNLMQQN